MGLEWNFFFFFFFLWFVVCGFYDQRRVRMVVTGLGGVAGFSVGLGMKNSCDQRGYIWIVGVGLFQDLMGQKLERYCHIWLACSFDVFAFKWLSTVVLYGPKVCFDTKTDVGQPHYFNGTNTQQ